MFSRDIHETKTLRWQEKFERFLLKTHFHKTLPKTISNPFCPTFACRTFVGNHFYLLTFHEYFYIPIFFSNLNYNYTIENSWPSASNFKSFSRTLEQFFLTVGENNFDNKIPFQFHRTDVFEEDLHKVLNF